MSLRPESRVANPYPETPADKGPARQLSSLRFQTSPAVGGLPQTDMGLTEEVEY